MREFNYVAIDGYQLYGLKVIHCIGITIELGSTGTVCDIIHVYTMLMNMNRRIQQNTNLFS